MRGEGSDAESPWGTLISTYDDNLQAEFDVLRRLAIAAREDLSAFDPGVGPIAMLNRPGSDGGPFSWPIRELDDHTTAALAAGGFACFLSGQDIVRATGHHSAGVDLARQSLVAVRRAVTRMRVLTGPDRAEELLDQASHESMLAELDKVTRSTAAWVGKVLLEAPEATDGGSWRDMRSPGLPGMQNITLVQIAEDRVTITRVGSHEGASDVPGIYHDLMVCEMTREELRDASFEVQGEGGAVVAIRSGQPVGMQWLSLSPADCTDRQMGLIGDGAVRGGRQAARVLCDSLQHAHDLAARLRRFVSGSGR
ncbi:MAG: hypothetical protein KDC98_00010 [Planctomycetes bacterium]|nr:hypothetical protein [Planctomycetota bacterium]